MLGGFEQRHAPDIRLYGGGPIGSDESMIEVIGWASSIILVVTIAKQVHKQWSDRTSAGVSTWLFLGQLAASIGFTIYSILVRNWVFTRLVTSLNAS